MIFLWIGIGFFIGAIVVGYFVRRAFMDALRKSL